MLAPAAPESRLLYNYPSVPARKSHFWELFSLDNMAAGEKARMNFNYAVERRVWVAGERAASWLSRSRVRSARSEMYRPFVARFLLDYFDFVK